jgi:hypothetical protein
MKKLGTHTRIRKGGILNWSTLALLAGSSAGLTSCDSENNYTATAEDMNMAVLQQNLDSVEGRKALLLKGEVAHNMEIPGLGFYHVEAQDFFPFPFGHAQNGKWYANGEWRNFQPSTPFLASSRPSDEALRKVETHLAQEQQPVAQGATSGHQTYHGGGVGNMLLMYWLLSGNRGSYTPGAGFQRAQTQQQGWQQTLNTQRQTVNAHAAANPGYQRLVEQSNRTGTPIKAGSSVRGGFGSSSGFSSSAS